MVTLFTFRFFVAAVITLQWNPNFETDVNSYVLYRGNTTQQYNVIKDVGNTTTTIVNDVDSSKDNFFAVTAKNEAGFESAPSNEVKIPKATPTPSPTPNASPPLLFVRAININGSAETIDGNFWISNANALLNGFTITGQAYSSSISFTPTTDAATQRMLNKGNWCPTCDINFTLTLSNGNYSVYIWTTETYRTNFRRFDLVLENVQVATNIGSIPVNTWKRYGPYLINVNDGTLNGRIVKQAGDTVLDGLEIWTSSLCPCATPCPSP